MERDVAARSVELQNQTAAGCTCSGYWMDGLFYHDRTRCPIHDPRRGIDTSLGQAGICGACGESMPDGPDACLGTIPGVSHACCGHGGACDPYVTLGGSPDQPAWQVKTVTLRGEAAKQFFALVRNGEWEEAHP